MTFHQEVRKDYFEWLYNLVCKERSHYTVSYKKLFEYLHGVEFVYLIRNDANRAKDGADLRYRFATLEFDERYSHNIVDILDEDFGDSSCSVLEMMIALAVRCEETIMDDPKYGDRTSQWFWGMVRNLGIGNMTDDIFDEDYVNHIICDFLNRHYMPDGQGGLFYIRDCDEDLREIEIWTQLCWYLDNFT